jgi:hypothetical protein
VIEFVQNHPFISLGLSHAFIFAAGYLLNHVRNGFKADRLWQEWMAAEEDPLCKEYLRNPIRDAAIPRDEDDWTGYQQAVRPTQVIEVGVRPSHEVLDDYVPTRNYNVYLESLPSQTQVLPEAPVSPAMAAYFGTPNYVGRHSSEGRTEAALRALNTATGSMPVINTNATLILSPEWRRNMGLPEVRELELV